MDELCAVHVEGCYGRASQNHHLVLRRHGDPRTIPVCTNCHTFIHTHVGESYSRGWLIHSWDASAADSEVTV